MNTPAHLIVGLAAFGKPGHPRVTGAALAGALLPDLSLYLLAGGALGLGVPAERVFGQLYYSDAWQAVFAVDNSVFVWGALLGVGLWLGRAWIIALAGAGLLHVALDFPLHAGDGRPHFWPLTDWVFDSPFSYWDGNHHGGLLAPLEIILSLGLVVFLWRRFWGRWMRALIATLMLAQLSVGGVWSVVFA